MTRLTLGRADNFVMADFVGQTADLYASSKRAQFLLDISGQSYNIDSCSPIERIFGVALACTLTEGLWPDGRMAECYVGESYAAENFDALSSFERTLGEITVWHQVKVGTYTVDFLAEYYTGVKRYFAVECDGHDFHEKTKDQVAKDKARDRYLQSRGIAVHRYSGSEIWRDPFGCASGFVSTMKTTVENLRKMRD